MALGAVAPVSQPADEEMFVLASADAPQDLPAVGAGAVTRLGTFDAAAQSTSEIFMNP